MRDLIIVSNRLPVTIGRTIRKSSGGLVTAMEGLGIAGGRVRWIGWPGGAIRKTDRQREFEAYLERHDYTAVHIPPRESRGYYEGLSNSSLWPVLHYFPHYMGYEESWWRDYRRANRRFADAVLGQAGPDDLVWIQDYHLMLLPAMLRAERPDLRIGFFLHTPFPSYEVFRCHPQREALLEGLLGADQVGFHTFGYLRHFRSTVLRLLGLESEIHAISHGDRRTYIGVYPIGINAAKFAEELATDRCRRRREVYRRIYRDKRIVFNVERLDYTKGLPRRLAAIDQFLEDYPDKNSIVFIFVAVPSRGEVPEYQALLQNVERQVGQINGKHATLENTPVHFIHKSVSFTDLCALYALADVALVTPLRDGMNLVAKEYVACQEEGRGVLVLSEFGGAAEELFSALVVNPYSSHQIGQRLREALAMPREEKRLRMGQMRDRVFQYDASHWARSFVIDLETRQPAAVACAVGGEEAVSIVTRRFHAARRIVCCLDWDGTLREFEPLPDAAGPTDAIRGLLERLDANPRVDTILISGRSRDDLESWFGPYRFALVAEHGYLVRPAGCGEWRPADEPVSLAWKEPVLKVFRLYEGMTPGSSVEEKRSAVVWHYRRSDPEFGTWKAQQLMSELYEMTSNLPVEIHHGKKIVEVSSIYINKGAAVARLLQDAAPDVVLAAGDDQTDESMFRLERDDLLTVKVGPGDTRARYRVDSPDAFRRLLAKALDATGQT